MPTLDRPFRPLDLSTSSHGRFDLPELADSLQHERQYRDEGKAGVTLTRDREITTVLQVLRAGSALREHRAPASAFVVLLRGRARFVAGDGAADTTLKPGTLVAFSSELGHALVADEDSACLIVIGGRGGAA